MGVHNSGLSYSSMMMEAYVPCWRRLMGKLLSVPVFRRGNLIVLGADGIFKMWRDVGDTREAFHHMSKVTWMTKLDALQPRMGKEFYEKEKEVKEEEPPDPTCSCWCCPYTPPPPG